MQMKSADWVSGGGGGSAAALILEEKWVKLNWKQLPLRFEAARIRRKFYKNNTSEIYIEWRKKISGCLKCASRHQRHRQSVSAWNSAKSAMFTHWSGNEIICMQARPSRAYFNNFHIRFLYSIHLFLHAAKWVWACVGGWERILAARMTIKISHKKKL